MLTFEHLGTEGASIEYQNEKFHLNDNAILGILYQTVSLVNDNETNCAVIDFGITHFRMNYNDWMELHSNLEQYVVDFVDSEEVLYH